jgi:ferric enterobactin receptor
VNSFGNIGTNDIYGFNVFGQIKLFNSLTFRSSINGFYADQKGVIAGEALRNGDFQYNIFLSGTYEIGQDYAFEVFGLFNSQRVTLQGRNPAFSIYNFAFKRNFLNKKASFGITMTNPFTPFLIFRQDLIGPGFEQSNVNAIPIRAFGVNFSYRFGKIEFKDPTQPGRGVRNRDQKEGEGGLGF